MRVEFEGKFHNFPDDATDDEIASALGGTAQPEGAARVGGFLGRFGTQGLVSGVTGIPAVVADSVTGVGRDIVYGAHKLASKAGVANAPNDETYYGDGPAFPLTALSARAGDEAGKAASTAIAGGVVEPRNGLERVAASGVEGTTAALTGTGVGQFLMRLGQKTLGGFLAAEPVIGATVGGVSGAAGAGAREAGLGDTAATAIGLGSGLAAGTAVSGGRAFFGYDPASRKYLTSTSDEGVRRLANETIQGAAANPARAAANIRGRRAVEADKDFVAPGYRELNTNAAQDVGIASNSQFIGDAAGGAIPARVADNNSFLTQAWERQGAERGAGGTVRRQATEAANRDLPQFGLTASGAGNAPARVEVTNEIRQMRRDTSPRRAGTTDATRSVNRETADALESVSERVVTPIPGTNSSRVQFFTTPERLQSVRSDISEGLAPPKANAPAAAVPSAQRSRGTAGELMGRVDNVIGANVPDIPLSGIPGETIGYPAYLARQRGLRGEADQRDFMRAQMERVAPTTNATTGANEFAAKPLSQMMLERNVDMAIPGSGNNMSISRLTPGRQAFIENMAELGTLGRFSQSAGTKSQGASTARQAFTAQNITNRIDLNMSPFERMTKLAASTPAVGRIGRTVAAWMRYGDKDAAKSSLDRVRDRMGQFATNDDVALDLLTGPVMPQRGVGRSALRQSVRSARYAGQSFLGSQAGDERQSRFR